jgi:RNA polymerase sigma-70 factor (ECF subfamily)
MGSPSQFVAAEHLVAAALAGDGRAFRQLVEPHLCMLYRVAYRSCRDPHMAEDAVQETLTLAYRRLHRYRKDASFKAYLAGIAVRQAHTLARSERRRLKRELASREPQRPVTPEEVLTGGHAIARVREALAQLPKKRRTVAIVRLEAGLSYREIAQSVGTSEASARVLVHMTIKHLRETLADLVDPDHPRNKQSEDQNDNG